MYFDPIYIIVGVGAALLSGFVRNRMLSTMKKLSQIRLSSGLSGKEVAEKMLHDHGIYDVSVISTGGQLTDHYNPAKRTVNLSESVYSQRSVTAAAVAAHEVGHAVQHATQYSFLQFRSGIVPIVSFASRLAPIIIMAGLVVAAIPQILLAGIILFAFSTIFSMITLPVEFDASKRALAWLETSRLTSGQELEQAKKGLHWAAMTYVVAALTSLAYLLYYLSIYNKRNN